MLRLDPGEGRIRTARVVPRLGGRRRVQRRARAAAGLRAAHGDRHRARRQRGRPAGRGLHPHRRRRHRPSCDGCPTTASGRDVRNGLNFTERGFGVRGAVGRLRPRAHRRVAAGARATWTGTTSSASSACAGSTPAASSPRSPTLRPRPSSRRSRRAQAARHGRLLRPQLPAEPVEGDRRPGAGAGGQPGDRPVRRRDDRQRGGLHRLPRLRGRGRRRRTCSSLEVDAFAAMIDRRGGGVPELPGRRDDAAHACAARRSTTGARSPGRSRPGWSSATHRERPGDPRPRRRRRLVRVRPDLRPPRRRGPADGGRVRRRARRARHDHARATPPWSPRPRCSSSPAAAAPASTANRSRRRRSRIS